MSGVGPFANHDHPVVVKDDHFTAIGVFENRGVENLLRPSLSYESPIETDGPGKMSRDPVKIMSGDHDRHSVVIDLVEEMNHIIAGTNIQSGSGLVQQDKLRIAQKCAPEKYGLLLAAGKFSDMPTAKSGKI